MNVFVQAARIAVFLIAGWNLRAQETLRLDLPGVTGEWVDRSTLSPAFLRGLRTNRLSGGWQVDLAVSNSPANPLGGPWIVVLEGSSQVTGIDRTMVSGAVRVLGPFTGEPVVQTLRLTVERGVPTLRARVFEARTEPVRPSGRTLDRAGLPLEDVTVTEVGPTEPLLRRSGRLGWFSLQARDGVRGWRFSRLGHLEAFRKPGEAVAGIPDAVVLPDVTSLPAPLPPHALPAVLPAGWTPLAAGRFATGGFELQTQGGRGASAGSLLVRWDSSTLAWRVVDRPSGTAVVRGTVDAEATVAWIQPDSGPGAPVGANVGEVLGGGVPPEGPATVVATGRVVPSTRPASTDAARVTVQGEVEFRSTNGPLPSGTAFRCEVREAYRLHDGTRRVLPGYSTLIRAHRVAADDGSVLRATFPLRPTQLLGGGELLEAVIQVDVLTEGDERLALVGSAGGGLESGGVRLVVPVDAVPGGRVVRLHALDIATLSDAGPAGLPVRGAFELDVAEIAPGARIGVLLSNTPPNQRFVLARGVFDASAFGYQPVLRMRSDAAGVAVSEEPAAGGLRGLDGGGQYLLLEVGASTVPVRGGVRDSAGRPAAGLVVRSGPWTALTASDGRYELLSVAGTAVVNVLDRATGDTALGTVPVGTDGAPATLNLDASPRGPFVVSVSPTNGAVFVARVSSVTVSFSRPLNPSTVVAAGAVQLVDTNGAALPASVSLNLAGDTLTLLPSVQLPASMPLTLRLGAGLRDRTARPLEGGREFNFSTEGDSLRRPEAILSVFELQGGVSGMTGGPGLAEPESPMILVNETTGFTSTVLSRIDGSFSNNIPAAVDDDLVLVLVNRNGTRNTVRPARQIFADGGTGVFGAGGIVTASGEDRTIEMQVAPGSVAGRTRIRMDVLPKAAVQALVSNVPPTLGRIVAPGVVVTFGEDRFSGPVDLAIPITEEELQAAGLPAGANPTNGVYALVVPIRVGDTISYLFVDQMEYSNGKLVTHAGTTLGELVSGGAEGSSLAKLRGARVRPAGAKDLGADLARANQFARRGLQSLFSAARERDRDVQEFIRDHAQELNAAAEFAMRLVGIVLGFAGGGAAGIQNSVIDGIVNGAPGPHSPSGTGPGEDVEGAIRDAQRQTHVLGLQQTAMSYVMLPLVMAAQAVPAAFVGQVAEIDVVRGTNDTFQEVRARALPGAMVALHESGPGVFTNPRPGRLDRGTLFSISDELGHYKILRAGARSIGTPEDFFLTASHPRYFGRELRRAANPLAARILSTSDFLFVRLVDDASAPPLVSVTHTPDSAEPDSEIEVAVVATSQGTFSSPTRPDIEASIGGIESVRGGPRVGIGDVTFQFVRSEEISTTSRRTVYRLRCSSRAVLTLRAAAYLPGSDRALVMYPIRIGSPLDRPDDPPPTDRADLTGPRVIRSEPAASAGAWPTDRPILIEFNEAMNRSLTNRPTAITLVPGAGEPSMQLSGDRRILSLAYPDLAPDTEYDLVLPASVAVDASFAHNLLDQVPSTSSRESFHLRFRTVASPSGSLPGVETGGGVVINGIHSYVLERTGPLDGAVVVYDLSRPSAPRRVAELSVPGFPRDLALIPAYSFVRRPGEAPQTRDLIAVGGGKVGSTFTREGEDLGGFQYLWIIDISDPGHPVRIASTSVARTGTASLNRLVWQPPLLTTLISDSATQQIDAILLQSFIYGLNLSPEEFREIPSAGVEGLDANGDGDFVDFALGDVLPLPGRRANTYAGLEGRFVAGDGFSGRWADHHDNGRMLGIVSGRGRRVGNSGQETGPTFAGAYRTIADGGTALEAEAATFVFENDEPKRVFLVSNVPLPAAGGIRLGNAALVSMRGAAGGGWLATIDVTEPLRPSLVASNGLPIQLGIPQSIQRLTDGRLALATSTDVLLLDPSRLGEGTTADGVWPALLGRIPGLGTGARTFALDPSGLAAAALGSRNLAVQVAPQIGFVDFPGQPAPVNPAILHTLGRDLVSQLLASAERTSFLLPARLKTVPGVVTSSVSPASVEVHHHVLVHAPGSAGATIPLILETLTARGIPVGDKGRGFPPVRAISSSALGQLGGALECAVPLRPLTAHRVSDDSGSPLYNVYLSTPFVLLYEGIETAELERLRQEGTSRDVFWSGANIRAGFDPSLAADNVLKPFAHRIEFGRMRAGVTATASGFTADYLMGPNPPPVTDATKAPSTFGTLSAHSGEFRMETIDFVLPGRRLPIRFERVCAGQDLFEGVFGRGWDFLYNQRLVELSGRFFASGSGFPLVVRESGPGEIARRRDLLLHTGRGRSLIYRHAGDVPPQEINRDALFLDLGWKDNVDGYYLPPEGVFDFVVRFRDGRFARLEPDGTQVWYAPDGRLEEMRDRYPANRLRFDYDEEGSLVRIADRSVASTRELTLGYYRLDSQGDTSFPNERASNPGEAGKVCRLRDYTGRELRFFYNACGELERREGPSVTSPHPDGFTGTPVTRYEVSGSEATPGANGVRGVSAGSTDGSTLFTAGTTPVGGVPVAHEGRGAGVAGSVSIRAGESLGGGLSRTTVGTPDGASAEMQFTPDRRLSTTVLSGHGASPATNRYEYAGSLLTRVTYAEGNSVSYEYHTNAPALRSRGNLRRLIKAAGPRGVAGPVPGAAEFLEFDAFFNFPVGATKDFAGNTVTLTRTPNGRDIGMVDFGGDGRVVRTFNSFGQLETETGPQGVGERLVYDDITGFLTERIAGPDGPNLKTRYGYAAGSDDVGSFNAGDLGLPRQILPPKSGSAPVHLAYDQREQLVTRSRGDEETRISYDLNGHPIRVETRLDAGRSRVQTARYEQNGFLREQTVQGVETVGADGVETTTSLTTLFDPDALFRVKKITFPGNRVQEFLNFDHLGRPHRMTLGAHAEDYAYDLDGNLVSTTRGGATDTFVYDGFSRLKRSETATGAQPEVAEFTYNGNGASLGQKITDSTGRLNAELSLERDALDRVETEIRTTDNGPTRRTWRYESLKTSVVVEASGETSETVFDSAGRPDRDSDSTHTVQYTPDENGNLLTSRSVEAAITFQSFVTPDAMDRPGVVADTVGTLATSRFRADGGVTNVLNALGHATGFGISKLGETLTIRRPNGVGFQYGFNDHRSQVAARDRSGAGLASATDATFRVNRTALRSGAETRYGNFDPRNQRPGAFSGAGVDAALTYDAQGRVTAGRVSYAGIIRDESAGYDALDRLTSAGFPGGQWAFEYDLLGPLKSATLSTRGAEYLITRRYRGDGAATRMAYPSPDPVVVELGRDIAGRPTTVVPDENGPVVAATTYTGVRLVGSQSWGTNGLRAESAYDLRGRLIGRRYLGPGGSTALADVRYQYDLADNLQVRQLVHRGGRADVFLYDAGNRLIAAHQGVRPAIELAADRAAYVPFDLPPGSEGIWKPGFNTRSYQYDLNGLDTFLGTVLLNPDVLPVFAFPTNFAGTDAFLLPQFADGFARDRDTLGNSTRVRLGVWPEGATEPVPVGATLRYDGLNHLVEIARDDGVRLNYQYDHAGLMFERRVQAAGVTTITTLVWDQGRLIAEYDRSGGANRLRARHHYFGGGDVPVATDRRDSDGVLRRQYYLTDGMGHVMALADEAGQALSRFEYDAWGGFRPEAPDTTMPRVLQARKTPAGFRIEFSETVLPPSRGGAFPLLDTGARSLGEVAEVVSGGETVGGTWQYEESVSGAGFGRTLQFLSSRPLAGAVEVRVHEGVVLDTWLNPNPGQNLALTLAPGAGDGAILFDEPAPDGPTTAIARSPFLFQGQYFDYEAGLIYMRARFYDPATGLFLQPDPRPYQDSPNLYAALANNPTSNRDPSGRMTMPKSASSIRGASPHSVRSMDSGLPVQTAPTRPVPANLRGASPGQVKRPTDPGVDPHGGHLGESGSSTASATPKNKSASEVSPTTARTATEEAVRVSIHLPESRAGKLQARTEHEVEVFALSQKTGVEYGIVHFRDHVQKKISMFVMPGKKASISFQEMLVEARLRGISSQDIVGIDHTHPHSGEAVFSAKWEPGSGKITGDVGTFRDIANANGGDRIVFRVIGSSETRAAHSGEFKSVPKITDFPELSIHGID